MHGYSFCKTFSFMRFLIEFGIHCLLVKVPFHLFLKKTVRMFFDSTALILVFHLANYFPVFAKYFKSRFVLSIQGNTKALPGHAHTSEAHGRKVRVRPVQVRDLPPLRSQPALQAASSG